MHAAPSRRSTHLRPAFRPAARAVVAREGATRGVVGRRGLTLIELIVVLAILVALSGLVVPLISGLGDQTNASTNASVVGDVNRSVGTFHTRFDKYPNHWDSLLTDGDVFYSKLHTRLPPMLTIAPLTATQATSLTDMGIHQLQDHDESQLAPNTTGTSVRSIAMAPQVVTLNKAVLTSSTLDPASFSMKDLSETSDDYEFIVVGLGTATTIRGTVMTDAPMLHAADPSSTYARVLCVFMIPGSGTTAAGFPAKYVGCFLPDGSSLRSNLDRYHNTGLE